jgi:hypothetical protein
MQKKNSRAIFFLVPQNVFFSHAQFRRANFFFSHAISFISVIKIVF